MGFICACRLLNRLFSVDQTKLLWYYADLKLNNIPITAERRVGKAIACPPVRSQSGGHVAAGFFTHPTVGYIIKFEIPYPEEQRAKSPGLG